MRRYTTLLFDLGNTLVYRIVTQERMLRLLCDEAGLALERGADYRGAVTAWRAFHAAHYLTARTLRQESALALREAEIILEHLAGGAAAARHASVLAPGLLNSPRWWGIYDDVPHVLDSLRAQGATMGIVSEWEPSLASFCRRMGLSHAFRVFVSSAAEGIVKPSPRLFELAVKRLGASAEETLFVGDDYRLDIIGARAAGITPVLVDRNDRFLDTDCLKIRRMDELLDIVSGTSSLEPTSRVCISGYSL